MIKMYVGSEFKQSQYYAITSYIEVQIVIADIEDQGFDADEALVIADDEARMLISNRTLMSVKRFQKWNAEGFMTLPRKSYQLLEWLVRHGSWSPQWFQWTAEFPLCDLCVEEDGRPIPAPYVCDGVGGQDIHLCPYHKARNSYRTNTILFLKGEMTRVPDQAGVL